jgi:hypothetical protein
VFDRGPAQDAGTYSLAGKTINGNLTLNGSSGADTLIGSSGNESVRPPHRPVCLIRPPFCRRRWRQR